MASEHLPLIAKKESPHKLSAGNVDAPRSIWHRVACVFWALLVGASVTLRLECSMRLSAVGTSPYIDAYCVSGLIDALSALCFLPFVSLEAMPRHSGPWLSALCLAPAATLIVSSRVLGECLVQLMLKFAVLFGALAVDTLLEGLRPKTGRVLGIIIVLSGMVIVGSHNAKVTGSADEKSAMWISGALLSTLASGMGYVLSVRFCMPKGGADAVSTSFVALVAGAALQLPACLIAWLSVTGFHVRVQDIHLWMFAALQGAFYTRSFQVLPKQISYAATFTFSLAAQLITAALFNQQKNVVAQSGGLLLVLFGAALSELSSF